MNKILLIVQREYSSRVKKKSFLLTTFLVPIFFIALYVGVIFLTKNSFEGNNAIVYVIDHSAEVADKLKSNKNISYTHSSLELNEQIEKMKDEDENTNILIIPQDFYSTQKIEFLSSGKPNIKTQSEIESHLEEIMMNYHYSQLDIDPETIKGINNTITTSAKEIMDSGEAKESDTHIAMIIAIAFSMLIYLSLFLYGAQVMRGIIEEKSSRIIEIIISSVKPFQLMMGKIIGIGLVGITQFVLWIVLSFSLLAIASAVILNKDDIKQHVENQTANSAGDIEGLSMLSNVNSVVESLNISELMICFFLFFTGGYMLYSALFAAVGSAVDSETEANQFTMPITAPLLLAYALSFGVLINDPHGTLATWLSFIPLTSPIAMLVRIPFGVPVWQIALSFILLVAGFLLTTWVASRIYRVGILMYGKKASFKELIKWFNYKN